MQLIISYKIYEWLVFNLFTSSVDIPQDLPLLKETSSSIMSTRLTGWIKVLSGLPCGCHAVFVIKLLVYINKWKTTEAISIMYNVRRQVSASIQWRMDHHSQFHLDTNIKNLLSVVQSAWQITVSKTITYIFLLFKELCIKNMKRG